MAISRPLSERLVFGPFEFDIPCRQLKKGGIPVRLSGQPLLILLMLLESPGEILTREQLRERVWSTGTFVDFEGGLNAAINKLRRALGDSADNPRYIETVTGAGYRFIGTLDAHYSLPETVLYHSPFAEQARCTTSLRATILNWTFLVTKLVTNRLVTADEESSMKIIRSRGKAALLCAAVFALIAAAVSRRSSACNCVN